MKDPIDEALNGLFGKRNNFTLDEIKKAQQKRRQSGDTFLDTLQEMTGRSLTMPEVTDDPAELERLCSEAEAQMDALEKESVSPATLGLAAFDGLAEDASKTVFGQDEALQRLVIAFKRPFLLPPEAGCLRNSIYLCGKENTGRHLALKTLARLMAERKLLKSGEIAALDLSLYGDSGTEKLFLQDLYAALASKAEIVLFENYESCHPAFLAKLSELVQTGKCPLSERYMQQNGQLIGINNALSSSSVAYLSAEGKYLVFISTKNRTKLADAFGAPFVNAIGDTVETSPLSENALVRIAAVEEEKLRAVAKEKLSFDLSLSPEIAKLAVSKACKAEGLSLLLQFYADILRALTEAKLCGSYAEGQSVSLTVANETVFAAFDGAKLALSSLLPTAYSGEVEAVKKELDEIVGLKDVKEYVLRLEEYYRVQQRRRAEGLPADEISRHMIFTGNPGTGKTTIARIISRYLKAIGVLSGGQLVEVSRADLVGRYVGHTAPLTNQVISSALGGVLFIDEAYSLYRGKDDSFGLEAIDTLVKGMEDHRNELIVVLAGYSKEMREFLTANSGLKSRFPNIIEFPDYTGEELLSIAKSIARGKGYRIDEGCENALLAYFNAVQSTRAADAGNGRLARNKVEEAILNQSRRLVAEPNAELSLLTSMDFDLNDI